MKKSRFTEEQMVAILRESDKASVPEVAKRHKVSAQAIYTWRRRFGTLEPADINRLRQLEIENAKLKKIVAKRDLGAALELTAEAVVIDPFRCEAGRRALRIAGADG